MSISNAAVRVLAALVAAVTLALAGQASAFAASRADAGDISGRSTSWLNEEPEQTGPGRGAVQFSLSPNHHVNCMLYKFPRHPIKSFTFKAQGRFSGKLRMLCGTDSGSGYRHINYKHKAQWIKKMNFHPGQRESNWDRFMFGATQSTLDNPVKVTAKKGSKLAFGGRVIQKKIVRGKVVKQTTWDTCVIVSKNQKTIITSYVGKCK